MYSKAWSRCFSRVCRTNTLFCSTDALRRFNKRRLKYEFFLLTLSHPTRLLLDHRQFGENRTRVEHDQRWTDVFYSQDLMKKCPLQHRKQIESVESVYLDFQGIRFRWRGRADEPLSLTRLTPYRRDWRDLDKRIRKSKPRIDDKNNLPLGNKWNANVLFTPLIGTTIVCPALFPPAHLAQTSISADKISTSLPFPSSPHCEPRTTVTD